MELMTFELNTKIRFYLVEYLKVIIIITSILIIITKTIMRWFPFREHTLYIKYNFKYFVLSHLIFKTTQ